MKKILLAEDEQAISKVLALKLIKSGYAVTMVGSGEEVVAEIAKNKYDLILLDLLMPKMDGWAVLEKLKGSNLKIVVMSNLGQDEDIKKAKALGALDFFIKSDVPLLDIVQKINTFLA